MRRVRGMICLVFLCSSVLFAGYLVKSKMVEDNVPPVITCETDEITVSVEDEEKALLEGIKAKDNRDGDLTDAVRVSSMSHFINGKRTVTYVVFDKANQAGMLERTVRYSDYTSPKIYLKKPLRFSISNAEDFSFSEVYQAEDCLDGDITGQVRTIMDNNFYGIQEGTFTVTLQVSNSVGDVRTVPVEMYVYASNDDEERDKIYPVLSDYIVYTAVGTEISPADYLTGVERGNTEYSFEDGDNRFGVAKGDIAIQSNVDYSTPGIYTVEYSYEAAGVNRAVTKMYVVVEGEENGQE